MMIGDVGDMKYQPIMLFKYMLKSLPKALHDYKLLTKL